MSKKASWLILATVLLGLFIDTAHCRNNNYLAKGKSASESRSLSADPGDYTVVIGPHDFFPTILLVPIGSTVTWLLNDSSIQCDIVEERGLPNPVFASNGLIGAEGFQFTFDRLGHFHYKNKLQPLMRGVIRVTPNGLPSDNEQESDPIPNPKPPAPRPPPIGPITGAISGGIPNPPLPGKGGSGSGEGGPDGGGGEDGGPDTGSITGPITGDTGNTNNGGNTNSGGNTNTNTGGNTNSGGTGNTNIGGSTNTGGSGNSGDTNGGTLVGSNTGNAAPGFTEDGGWFTLPADYPALDFLLSPSEADQTTSNPVPGESTPLTQQKWVLVPVIAAVVGIFAMGGVVLGALRNRKLGEMQHLMADDPPNTYGAD